MELMLKKEGVDQKRLKIAYHETGHAVMALVCGQEIQKVSLREMDSPRGSSRYLGFTTLEPFEQTPTITINESIRRIRIALGGYASELLFTGGTGIGCDDLTRASNLVEGMLANEDFKNWVAGLPVPESSTLPMIDNRFIKAYINHILPRCRDDLAPFARVIQLIAGELYKKEELTGDEVTAIFNSFLQSNSGGESHRK